MSDYLVSANTTVNRSVTSKAAGAHDTTIGCKKDIRTVNLRLSTTNDGGSESADSIDRISKTTCNGTDKLPCYQQVHAASRCLTMVIEYNTQVCGSKDSCYFVLHIS